MSYRPRTIASLDDDPNRATTARAAPDSLDDRSVREAVVDELVYSPGIDAELIGVAVQRGAVTITGHVPTLPMTEAVAQAALRTRGVAAIADDMMVRQPGDTRDDTDMAGDVAAVLVRSVVVPEGSVRASVADGVVTLVGAVGSDLVRDEAGRSLVAIPGVRGICNEVPLRSTGTATAAATEAEIGAALVRHAQVDSHHIHVTVESHRTVLCGTVASWAGFQQSQQSAYACPGIT